MPNVIGIDHLYITVADLARSQAFYDVVLGQVLPEMKRALDRAYEAGVIVVCAAGNYVDPVVAPARLSRTVGMAAPHTAEFPVVAVPGAEGA